MNAIKTRAGALVACLVCLLLAGGSVLGFLYHELRVARADWDASHAALAAAQTQAAQECKDAQTLLDATPDIVDDDQVRQDLSASMNSASRLISRTIPEPDPYDLNGIREAADLATRTVSGLKASHVMLAIHGTQVVDSAHDKLLHDAHSKVDDATASLSSAKDKAKAALDDTTGASDEDVKALGDALSATSAH
jgi:hypothetical protein